jgi:hypothetical protein
MQNIIPHVDTRRLSDLFSQNENYFVICEFKKIDEFHFKVGKNRNCLCPWQIPTNPCENTKHMEFWQVQIKGRIPLYMININTLKISRWPIWFAFKVDISLFIIISQKYFSDPPFLIVISPKFSILIHINEYFAWFCLH